MKLVPADDLSSPCSRTGVDVRAGKVIRKDSHGFENFSDFFTDSESESGLCKMHALMYCKAQTET